MKKVLLFLVVCLVAFQWWKRDENIRVSSNDVSYDYIVKYSGGAHKRDTLPLLIALHGNGDTPQNFYRTALDMLAQPARVILLKGPVVRSLGSAWPWSAAEFEQYGEAFGEAVSALAVQYPTRGKPVLLGFSGGGMMAFYQALKRGDIYAAIFPVSGQLNQEMLGEGSIRTGASVFAYHGSADRVISIAGAKNAIALLHSSGVVAELTEFNGGHHGIFNNMKAQITQTVEQVLAEQ